MLCFSSIDKILTYGSSLLKEKEDELIEFVLSILKTDILNLSKEEILSYNHFLYFLIYYVPEPATLDFAYSLPKNMYAKAQYVYALYVKIFGLGKIRNVSKRYKENDKEGVRSFINLKERETLSLIQRNPFVQENDYIANLNIKGSYPSIRKLNSPEKKEILNSLLRKECINIIAEDILELAPGGFFLLSCFNV